MRRQGARVSWLSLKTKVDGLSVVWPQNHWEICQWFGLKTTGTVFSGLPSKLMAMVFFGFASKLVVGFLVEPQIQGGGGFPSLGIKTDSYSLVI
jgi:hypothetical protein